MGVTAAIGTGFAGIFYDNARKNGLALPIVTPEMRDTLLILAANEVGLEVTVDIENRVITASDLSIPFEMDDPTQAALIRGGDDTLDSLEYADAIRGYEATLGGKMRVSVIK